MRVLKMIKELQAELMTGKDLPHVVSVRLLARLDEAERHLPAPQPAPPAPAPQPPVGELAAVTVKDQEGGSSTGSD